MWQYKVLQTGFFHADGGAMFGAIPKKAWSRRYPADEENRCILAMNCLLAWNGSKVVLLDTGVGTKDLGKFSGYGFYDTKDIAGLLREQGFRPEDVTDVVLSHLHFDHCGGCTFLDPAGKLQVTFPCARHWVGKKQWENFLHPNGLEKHSYRIQDMLPVAEAGLLQLVELAHFDLASDFHAQVYRGHTAGQLVSVFDTPEGKCVFPGDVIPTQAHWSDDWISAYDVQPLHSLAAKVRLKKEVQGCRMIFYHDAHCSSIQL